MSQMPFAPLLKLRSQALCQLASALRLCDWASAEPGLNGELSPASPLGLASRGAAL
jgi:hypothetical protein